MLPKHHAIAGITAAALLYPFFGLNVWVITATVVAIDIDHFFIYAYRTGKYDLKMAYAYFRRVKEGGSFYPVFHMFETFAIILFAGLYFNILFLKLVSIGMLVHILHDLIEDLFLRTTRRNFFAVKLLYEKR